MWTAEHMAEDRLAAQAARCGLSANEILADLRDQAVRTPARYRDLLDNATDNLTHGLSYSITALERWFWLRVRYTTSGGIR